MDGRETAVPGFPARRRDGLQVARAENKAATKLRSTHPFPVSATQYVRGAGHAQYSDHTRMNGKFAFVVLPFHSKACLRPLIVQTITSPLPSNLR